MQVFLHVCASGQLPASRCVYRTPTGSAMQGAPYLHDEVVIQRAIHCFKALDGKSADSIRNFSCVFLALRAKNWDKEWCYAEWDSCIWCYSEEESG